MAFVERRRIAIIGSKGRLGAALNRLWSPSFEILPFSRKDLDISQLGEVRRVLENLSCDYLVNCSGLTNVDYCEEHPEEAFLLNAMVPALMAEYCVLRGIRFIHFSTDYVFGGERAGLLTEKDPTIPINQYGWSKLEGEKKVLEAATSHVVLRVSWLFGPDKLSFIDSILTRALTQDRVEAITDKISCPTYAHDIAEWTQIFLQNKTTGGIYHLCNSGECSWRDYGQYGLDCARECGMRLKATAISSLKLDEIKIFQARRPRYSAMSTEKFAAIWGRPLRSWKDAVHAYISSCLVVRNSYPTA